MFKDYLAKIGKSGTRVDLRLGKEEYTLGETITGSLVIQGGIVAQHINKVDIDFVIHMQQHDKVVTHLIKRFSFDKPFQIEPGAERSFPFTYTLPINLLLSGYSISYSFATRLDIAQAVDQTDHNPIVILPPPSLHQIQLALRQLGFREKYGSRSFDGYLQKFEFTQTSDIFEEITELQFVAKIETEGIRLLLEVELEENHLVRREVRFNPDQLDDLATLVQTLRRLIQDMVDEPQRLGDSKKYYFRDHEQWSKLGAIGGFAAGLTAGTWFKDDVKVNHDRLRDHSWLHFGGIEEKG
ncbi:sporulation protein [Laceyella putida]|uniref:Sporulation protein n=1 Tax=Laceyella putida TaxID=110101 RepID=A0ABW2RGS9_9BACL